MSSNTTSMGLLNSNLPVNRSYYTTFPFNRIVGNYSGTLVNTTVTLPDNPVIIFGFEQMQMYNTNNGWFEIYIYLNDMVNAIHYTTVKNDTGGGYSGTSFFTACISQETLAAGTYPLKINFNGAGTNFYIGAPVQAAIPSAGGSISMLVL